MIENKERRSWHWLHESFTKEKKLTKTIFQEALVKTEDIIAHLFCPIDDRMRFVPKHPQVKIHAVNFFVYQHL